MLKRLNRLIFILIILSLALWVVLLNEQPVTLKLGGNQEYPAHLGAMIVFTFAAGVLSTAIVASLFGFRAYLRERSFLAAEKRRYEFGRESAKARALTLAEKFGEAKRLWESLCKRDPKDVQARLWLANTLEREGSSGEALKVLDAARAAFPGDLEVLFRAAELNAKLGNKTAAVDNLALVISGTPSEKAVRDARNLSVELGRLADALEYNAQLEKVGSDRQELREFEAKIRFQQVFSQKQSGAVSDAEYVNALKQLVRDYPEASAALVAISELEAQAGNFEEASQALVKAALNERTIQAWQRPIELWIAQKQPERALAIARLAIKESSLQQRAEYELLLAKIYLQFGMYTDARTMLESLNNSNITTGSKDKVTAMLGKCLLSAGEERQAAELWRSFQ
jgi:tetratricopeptide (TPR) repeat protein